MVQAFSPWSSFVRVIIMSMRHFLASEAAWVQILEETKRGLTKIFKAWAHREDIFPRLEALLSHHLTLLPSVVQANKHNYTYTNK